MAFTIFIAHFAFLVRQLEKGMTKGKVTVGGLLKGTLFYCRSEKCGDREQFYRVEWATYEVQSNRSEAGNSSSSISVRREYLRQRITNNEPQYYALYWLCENTLIKDRHLSPTMNFSVERPPSPIRHCVLTIMSFPEVSLYFDFLRLKFNLIEKLKTIWGSVGVLIEDEGTLKS